MQRSPLLGVVPKAAALPFLLITFSTQAQTLTPQLITPLPTSLNETSGLVMVDGEWWTHLDSGNPNALYSISTSDGSITRQVTVSNAPNTDWEDITTDGEWLYIGDFGNNSGSRTNLRIFRVPLDDLLDPANTSVTADTIRFAYEDQTDFTAAAQNTIWDCEAMVAKDDSLFLFTKRWTDQRTVLYALPAEPGDHLAERRDSLDAQGLITGATYLPLTGAIALLGYTNGLFVPFVWELGGYPGNAFFSGSAQRRALSLAFVQTEGIAWNTPSEAYITNEQSPLSAARLWRLGLGLTTADNALVTERRPHIHPMPATSVVYLTDTPAGTGVRLIDLGGRVVRTTTINGDGAIDLQYPAPGTYVLEWTKNGTRIASPIMIIGN